MLAGRNALVHSLNSSERSRKSLSVPLLKCGRKNLAPKKTLNRGVSVQGTSSSVLSLPKVTSGSWSEKPVDDKEAR